jgi:hypothetical protein
MEQPKVTIVMISTGQVLTECLNAICSQDYPSSKLDLIVNEMPAQNYHRTNKYVCGRWVADHVFFNFTTVRPGLVRTDCVGLGCAFVSRRVLAAIEFEPGTDIYCKDASNGGDIILGECGIFGNRVAELGIPMYMDGNVISEHLERAGCEVRGARSEGRRGGEGRSAKWRRAD